MEQIPVDKYNIAWFRLAEYISRGEKERALGMYRLLCHSFDDAAFARQLEGDILWSFNDLQATAKYYEAAQLYQQDKRMLQAAAVYENLLRLDPGVPEYLQQLLSLYSHLALKTKVIAYAKRFAVTLLTGKLPDITESLETVARSLLSSDIPLLYEQYALQALESDSADEATVRCAIERAIREYLKNDDFDSVSQFLDRLKLLSHEYHAYACDVATR